MEISGGLIKDTLADKRTVRTLVSFQDLKAYIQYALNISSS